MTEVIDSSVLTRKNRIAGADDARPQQCARHRQKRRIGRDKFVLTREADDFVDGGLVFAVALDLFQQRIDARARPQAAAIGDDRRTPRGRFVLPVIWTAPPSRTPCTLKATFSCGFW